MNNSYQFSWKYINTKEIKKDLLEALSPELSPTLSLNLKGMEIPRIDAESVVLQFSTDLVKNQVKLNIENSIVQFFKQNLPVGNSFEVKYSIKSPTHSVEKIQPVVHPISILETTKTSFASRFNADYTFESFVCGPSNRYSYESAVAVSKSPGHLMHNPLFIYGSVGLGKTHLLHAIGNFIRSTDPAKRVLLMTCEEMLNHFVQGLKSKDTGFRKWRDVDVLLVDDVQFLGGKQSFQDEFYNTYNSLAESNRQLVFAADRTPEKIDNLEERLISRFRSGILADIQLPDLETKMAITADLFQAFRVTIENDAIELIARSSSSNVRELKGVCLRLCTKASFLNKHLSRDFVREHIDECVQINRPPLDPQIIMGEVADHYRITREDLLASTRKIEVAFPRQVAMYLVKEFTNLVLQQIGELFGRTHQTVMHACQKMETVFEKAAKAKAEGNFDSKDLRHANEIQELKQILGTKYDHASTHR